jgi:hypothetical protein
MSCYGVYLTIIVQPLLCTLLLKCEPLNSQRITTRIVVIIVKGKTLVPWTQARKKRHFRKLPTERLSRYFHRQNKYYFRRILRR